MPLRDIGLAVLVVAIWGVNFVAIKLGVAEMSPLAFTGLRYVFAAFPVIFFVRPPKAPILIVAAYGIAIGVVSFGLLFVAVRLGMPGGLSSVVMQFKVCENGLSDWMMAPSISSWVSALPSRKSSVTLMSELPVMARSMSCSEANC